MKINIEDVLRLEDDAKISFIKSAMEKKLDRATRTKLEDIYFEYGLKEGIDNIRYHVEWHGSKNMRSRLARIYIAEGRIDDAYDCIEKNTLDQSNEEMRPRLEKIGIERLLKLYGKKQDPELYKDYDSDIRWEFKRLSKVKDCSLNEAKKIIAEKLEKRREKWCQIEAGLLYEKAKDIDNALRVFLECSNSMEAVKFLERHKMYEKAAEIWKSKEFIKNSDEEKEYCIKKACLCLTKAGNIEEARILAEKYKLDELEKLKKNPYYFEELELKNSSVSPEKKKGTREFLEREYADEIDRLMSETRVGDGGPPIGPSESEYAKAKRYEKKLKRLLAESGKYGELAKYEDDFEKKAELYIKSGMKKEAIHYLGIAARVYAEEFKLKKSRELTERIKELQK
jgi:hypothetical protein